VKKTLILLCAIAITYCSCTKDRLLPKHNSFKISIKTNVNDVEANVPGAWTQVLGGSAQITFTKKNSDSVTVSPLTNTIDLANLTSLNWTLIGGAYDIELHTTDNAFAAHFIRFRASAKNVPVETDGPIAIPAVTTDGVITINKNAVDTTFVPTFKPEGGNTTNFSKANGYYFLYVQGFVSGKLTFTEATTGDVYMKNLEVVAGNQYDISAKLNSTNGIVINSIPFHLKASVLK